MLQVVSALVEVCRVRPADPLEYVGNFLLEAGRKAAEAHVDPYESEIYAIQVGGEPRACHGHARLVKLGSFA